MDYKNKLDGQISINPRKINTYKQISTLIERLCTVIENELDYKLIPQHLLYHSGYTATSLSYEEFSSKKPHSLWVDDFSIDFAEENKVFKIEITCVNPFSQVALVAKVEGNDYDAICDVMACITKLTPESFSWKTSEFLSERDFQIQNRKLNNKTVVLSSIASAVVGAVIANIDRIISWVTNLAG